MSRWLSERVQCIFLRLDAGPSRLTCPHRRRRCDCDRPAPAPPAPTPEPVSVQPPAVDGDLTPNAPGGANLEPWRLGSWRHVVDGPGDWRDTIAHIVDAIRPFPDALKAVLAVWEPRDAIA